MTVDEPQQPMEVPILEDELAYLSLDLSGNPSFDHLAVFIRDPENPEQYWFRKLYVLPQSDLESGVITYEDHPMGEFNSEPCPEEYLEIAIKQMISYQIEAARDQEECIRQQQAQVGVANYEGEKGVSLDRIISLTAAKYNVLRQNWIASQN